MLASLLDWYIEKWTRHGKLLLFNTLGVDPKDSMATMQLACALVVMGRNTFIKGHPEWGYANDFPLKFAHFSTNFDAGPLSDRTRVSLGKGYVATQPRPLEGWSGKNGKPLTVSRCF